MRKEIFIAVMLAAIAPLFAQSQKRDLSGSWRLNVAKSFRNSSTLSKATTSMETENSASSSTSSLLI